jgi:flavodoxin
MKTLIVYYSRTGTTKSVASEIKGLLSADMEELEDVRSRGGIGGYMRSAAEATLGIPTYLRATRKDAAAYGLVIIGTPVWNASVSSPVRTYLEANRHLLHRVAFFCTMGGRGAEKTFRQMESICGRKPIATLSLREADVRHARGHRVESFVESLRKLDAGARTDGASAMSLLSLQRTKGKGSPLSRECLARSSHAMRVVAACTRE